MIKIHDLRFDYGRPDDFQLLISSLEIAERERVALIGPSGSGKTSLAYLVAGILTPCLGEVCVGDFEVSRASDEDRRNFRINRIGFIFQEFELIEYLSGRDNILLPYAINRSLPRTAEVETRAEELVGRMGLGDKWKRYPHALSQGEKQRLAICRSLIVRPALLIGDEPTGDLDPANSRTILDLIFEEATASGATLLLITHDHSLLDRFDRIIDVSEYARGGRG